MIRILHNPAAVLRRIVAARSSLVALYGFAVLEAAILPVPIEAVIAPYMQMRRDILWQIAAIALAGYVTAGVIGFGIGAFFYDEIGAPVIAALGWQGEVAGVEAFLGRYGFWAMIAMGLTPLPTQLGTIMAGALGVPPLSFLAAIILSRGSRNFGVALLVKLYGDRVVRYFVHRRRRKSQPPR